MRYMMMLLLPFLLAACGGGDGTGPGEGRVPRLGRYDYTSTVTAGGNFTAATYAGTLTLTAATKDAITGTWAVPGFKSGLETGTWNEDAYRIVGDPETFGQIAHRVTRSASGLACEGVIFGVAGGEVVSQPVVCTFVYAGP